MADEPNSEPKAPLLPGDEFFTLLQPTSNQEPNFDPFASVAEDPLLNTISLINTGSNPPPEPHITTTSVLDNNTGADFTPDNQFRSSIAPDNQFRTTISSDNQFNIIPDNQFSANIIPIIGDHQNNKLDNTTASPSLSEQYQYSSQLSDYSQGTQSTTKPNIAQPEAYISSVTVPKPAFVAGMKTATSNSSSSNLQKASSASSFTGVPIRQAAIYLDALAPAAKLRLNPTPVTLEPQYLSIPTRKWVDRNSFVEIAPFDPLADTINKTFAGQFITQKPARKLMNIEEALQNAKPYESLIFASSWRSVALLAKNDLIGTHPIDLERIMKLWLVRWWALAKLSRFEVIRQEAEKLDLFTSGKYEAQNMLFESHPDIFPGKNGSMISIELRLFACLVPSFIGNHSESIHELYMLMYRNKGVVLSKEWRIRIVFEIVNLLIQMQDYGLALEALSEIVSKLDFESQPDVWAAIIRLTLMVGDVEGAQNLMTNLNGRVDLQLSCNAFLQISLGNYEHAQAIFTDLVAQFPDDPIVMNNLAVNQLLMGNVSQASAFLEVLVFDSSTKKNIRCEPLVSNLTNMYELIERSAEKKRKLVKVAAGSVGDDFNPVCLKTI